MTLKRFVVVDFNADETSTEVKPKVTIEIIQYMKSNDEEKAQAFLKKKLVYWTRENFLKENDQ